jgi:outer membrane protein TolC
MRGIALILGALLSVAASAQEYLTAPRFPEAAYFRRHFAERPEPVRLRPASRLGEFVVDGKLELSMRSYLELVLANNTDIQIQRLSIEPQRNAITRAFAPFDAAVTAFFQTNRSTTPSYTALEGVDTLSQLRQPLRFSFQQTLESGTQYTVGFEGTKSSSNNSFATFNPALSASFSFGFSQPLLRNRGRQVNRLPILIARTRYNVSRLTLEHQLTRILEEVQNTYWAVVETRENLRVQEKSLEALSAVLKRHKRELELGEIAPVDIYQPEQVHAAQGVIVTETRYRLQQAEDTLRRAIGADMDPMFRSLPLVLTESILAAEDQALDSEAWVRTALQLRPDLKAGVTSLDIDDMVFQQSKNALLPDLSLVGSYTSAGRGGRFIERSDLFSPDGSIGDIVRTTPGGLGDALTQVLRFGFPTYSLALNLRLPIRDRRAAADLADATIAKRLDTLRVRALQQQIRLEVVNAVSRVESSRASMKLAQISVDYAKKRLEAEQRKYERGITTIFFLLDAQTSLTLAEADLVERSVQYQQALVRLRSVTATLLNNYGIVVQ